MMNRYSLKVKIQEQEQYSDSESLGRFLRKAVYEMPEPSSFVPRTMLNFPDRQPKIKLG